MQSKEKFRRLYYALRRYKKKHTEQEFAEHSKQTLDKAISMAFYTGFDQQQFQRGKQYRYITMWRNRIEKQLAKVKAKDQA